MLTELVQKSSLFHLFLKIDTDFAEKHRKKGCPYCGGTLHYSNYFRKPRGGPKGLPDKCLVRFSLCCSRENCRRRTLPPSCRFSGRRVYWHAVILVVLTLRQNNPSMATSLRKLFNITYNTLARWIAWYREIFPTTPLWQRVRGLVSPSIRNENLPAALLGYFMIHDPPAEQALISCLTLISEPR